VGIELLCAGQGIEFHRPLTSSPPLERALALLRQRVSNYDHDRLIHPDIEAATALIEAGDLATLLSIHQPL
jgi:histidine ammonia-lyase